MNQPFFLTLMVQPINADNVFCNPYKRYIKDNTVEGISKKELPVDKVQLILKDD